jgi:hypothetical protein
MISDLLKSISELDDDNLSLFIYSLNLGMENEWDCDISEAYEIFKNGLEWSLAARSGTIYAKYVEDNR